MTFAKTAWDTVIGTASASVDIVLMQATRPLSNDEIAAEIRRLGLPERQSPNPHLTMLKDRGLINNEARKWFMTPAGKARLTR